MTLPEGAKTKAGMGTANPVTFAFEYTDFTGGSTKPHISAEGNRGTLSHIAERAIEGVEDVAFGFGTSPNIVEAGAFLEFAGFLNTTGTYSLLDVLTAYYFTFDKITKVPTYNGVKCDTLTITASKNATWKWTFSVRGAKETDGAAASFPAISITEAPPLALHHAVLTLLGSARSFSEVSITINFALDAQSNNADHNEMIEPSDRRITVDLTLPYTAENADLKDQGIEGDDAAVLEFTYGDYVATFTFGNLKFPKGAVEIPGKSGLMLKLSGQAYMTGSTKELVVTLDDGS